MEVYLDLVKESKKDILYRLLEYSLYEESANDLNEMNDEAIFEYKYFDKYFTDNDRDAYFIREKETDKLLGFAFVNTYVQKVENGHSIAEFMVIPKYRRNHIGSRIAHLLFDSYKGFWEVKPALNSNSAYNFWHSTIKKYTDNFEFIDGIFIFKNSK